MAQLAPVAEPKEVVRRQAISLYPSDLKDLERLRRHFDLDSLSQTIRRVVRLTVKDIDASDPESSAA